MKRKNAACAIGIAIVGGAAPFAAPQTAPPPPSPCADYAAGSQWDASISFNYAHAAQDADGRVDLSADAGGQAPLVRRAAGRDEPPGRELAARAATVAA